jgi:hypothetical protein
VNWWPGERKKAVKKAALRIGHAWDRGYVRRRDDGHPAVDSRDAVYNCVPGIETVHYAQDDGLEITGTRGMLWITRGHGRISYRPRVMLYAKSDQNAP